MPFDNYMVEQVLTGQQLSDFCDSMAMKKKAGLFQDYLSK
jgi:hypothetical protein